MRVLVIEDEQKLARYIKKGLEEQNFAVDLACDGERGLSYLSENDYDVIVLDLLLPKKDGLTILQELRAEGDQTPVLILTARDALSDKVAGFDAGADDYLTKPFSFLELLLRVRALLRRGKVEPQVKLQAGDLLMDLTARRVSRAGKTLQLTSKEFALLEFFLRNPGRVLTRTTIAEHVWDYGFEHTLSNVIDVFVNRLRQKIDRDFHSKLLHTIKGVGYVLQEKAE
jgi:two-component system, OmpR family, copper resistance phosphate regulon response regulator CusR